MKICKVEKIREIVDTEYNVCDNKYCCNEMRYALEDKDIETYSDGSGDLRHTFQIVKENITIPLASDMSGTIYRTKINYCPWCGERIEKE